MFTDLKSIENEINQFKSNMNSVDGLMSAVKEICSKMDHQVSQGDQFIERLENAEGTTSIRLNKIAVTQENFAKEQMNNIEASTEKQADRLMHMQQQFENNSQAVFQANRNFSQEAKSNINKSIQQLNDSTNAIVQMTRTWLSEHREISSKAIESINDQINQLTHEQQKAIEDMNFQIAKLAFSQNEINQYYDIRVKEIDHRTSELQKTTSVINKKVKLFGIMTVAGILVLGLLIVLL